MHDFHYVGSHLYCEEVSLATLAEKLGTPLYVYSQNTLKAHYQKLDEAMAPLDHQVFYAVKANSNLAVLKLLARMGSGFDIVSEGEFRRVIEAGGDPGKCIFAGVGKSEREIELALEKGIYSFNFESEAELARINQLARRMKKIAPVAARVNPNIDAGTHAKITTGTYENKFGIAFEDIEGVYERAAKLKNIRLRGVQMHIGSQLTQVEPFELAVKKMLPLVQRLTEKHALEFFSIGGGLGIVYNPAVASGVASWWKTSKARGVLTPALYAQRLTPLLEPLNLKILVEPGRYIVGNAGILLTRVEYIKRTGNKNFVVVDAGMNDLIRPAFYESYHEIVPLHRKAGSMIKADVVGPICESGDCFAKDRQLTKVGADDYLAFMSAGAYGSVMGSNYNSRGAAAEVLVNGSKFAVVRKRQPLETIWELEQWPQWMK